MNHSQAAAILITLMFFLSGIEKIMTFSKTTMGFATKINIPLTLSKLIMIGVILLEIIAPIVVVVVNDNPPLVKTAILSLIAFTAAATVMYHNPLKGGRYYHEFLIRLALIGGLLALYKLN